jgi:hypothetical protein
MTSVCSMVLALLAAAGPAPADESTQRLTLTGVLKSEAGAPVAGGTVFIHTAGPRQGTSSTCPSCYLDCRKKAQTDKQGAFRIEALDPRLRFNLLVIARGYKAQIVSKVDPLAGPQAIALAPLNLAALPKDRVIRGKLSLPDGRPAVGAVVEVNGVRRGDTTRFGGNDDVDPVAVADAKGQFALVTKEPVSELLVRIDAPGVARQRARLTPGEVASLRMTAGVTVKGRVLDGGKPVGAVAMGMVSEDRRSESFLGDYEVSTEPDGRFTFRNMPPAIEFVVYGKMESFGARGVPATLLRTTGDDGSTLDLGDLTVAPGRTVSGKVVIKDGKPIPEGTRLGLYRREAWDHLESVIAPDGSFQFAGVPPESVSLSTRVKGYLFSYDNPNIEWPHRSINGRVDRNIADLTLVMEPGERGPIHSGMKPPPGVQRNNGESPLRPAKLTITPAAAKSP